MKTEQQAFLIKNVSCDCCGYCDRVEKFLILTKEEEEKEPLNVGVKCPMCNNITGGFDFDPDNLIPQAKAETVTIKI